MSKIIGIDLGNTSAVVCYWNEDLQQPVLIPNLAGQLITPSLVTIQENGQILVGEDAKQELLSNPGNVIRYSRDYLGTNLQIQGGGNKYTPYDVASFILGYLKSSAEEYLKENVDKVVISIPTYYKEKQQSEIRLAARTAGLDVYRLINEPTAASLAYGIFANQDSNDKAYIVCDWGTAFDVSIIVVSASDTFVVSTNGDVELGGVSFDNVLVEWLLKKIGEMHKLDYSTNEYVKTLLSLEAENAKKSLVTFPETILKIKLPMEAKDEFLDFSIPMLRKEFKAMIIPIIEQAINLLKHTVAEANKYQGVDCMALDGLLLVGGLTRIDTISNQLQDFLRDECPSKELRIWHDPNPDMVVAMGTAIVGAIADNKIKTVTSLSAFTSVQAYPVKSAWKYHVFLSYSRKDKVFMQKVKDDLRDMGLNIWTDEALEPGTPTWERALSDALRQAGCLVVILSPDAEQSEWVGRELAMAETLQLRIFPVMVSGNERNAIPFRLISHQWIDARGEYQTAIQKLAGALKRHLEISV